MEDTYKERADGEANLELSHAIPHSWGDEKVHYFNVLSALVTPPHLKSTAISRLQALATVAEARSKHKDWDIPERALGSVDDYWNLLPMRIECHRGFDNYRWYIDPKVLPSAHARCSPIMYPHSLSQTLQFCKGEFWDTRLDSLVEKRLGQKIDAPHVPQWLFWVYKLYVYDVEVAEELKRQNKKAACCGCKKDCANGHCPCVKNGVMCTSMCLRDSCKK